ncbi:MULTISPECIES: hypothetical protein [Sphingobacterium]|uniref:hypothetical protein n=1 Tax=Sphingobacterium TaxID=28453 RepID=UPI00257B6CF6|nr:MULTISPECIES: hypothetical protein [Sphingobacterium]
MAASLRSFSAAVWIGVGPFSGYPGGMAAFGVSFARAGSGVSAGLESETTRTHHGRKTFRG